MPDLPAITAVDITARDSTQGAFASVAAGMRGLMGTAGLMRAEFTALQSTLATVASTLGVATFGLWAKDVVAAAAALDDLSDSTGSTVENLSRLSNQAKISGVDFSTLQGLMLKLAAGMAGVEEEGSKTGRAMQALGISAKDPAQALQLVAEKLNEYADGTGKAALARDLFGKGGPAFLAMLKDLAQSHGTVATVTAEQAKEAEKLEQGLRRISVEGTTLKNMLLSDLVPAVNKAIEQFRLARSAGLGIFTSAGVAGLDANNIAPWVDDLQKKTAAIRAEIEQIKRTGNPFTSLDLIAARSADLEKLNRQLAVYLGLQAQAAQGSNADKYDRYLMGLQGAPVGTFKQSGYTGFPDKTGVDEYAKALQAAQKIANEAELAFDELGVAVQDRVTPAWKRLIELQNDPVWATFSVKQRRTIEDLLGVAAAGQRAVLQIEAETKATMASIAAEENAAEVRQRASDARVALVLGYEQANDVLRQQNAIIGDNELARSLLAAKIEYETAVTKLGTDATQASIDALREAYEVRKQLIAEGFGKEQLVKDLAEQAAEWKRTYDKISDTITDALMRGFEGGKDWARNFFDTLKNMAATLILRPIVQAIVSPLAGGITGLISGAAQAGTGSAGGGFGLFGGAGSMFGGAANLFGSAGGGLSEVIFGAQNSIPILSQMMEGVMPELLTGIGAALPWAALAAIAVPMIIKAFDKGDAMRTGTFASNSALGPGNPLFQSSSAFGTFGVFNDKWFSDKDMGPAMQSLLSTIKGLDNAIAQAVGPALTQTITAALQTGKGFDFGMEHTDLNSSGVAGGILKTRYTDVLNAIEAGLGDLLKGFEGTGEELAKFVLGVVGVHSALADTTAIVKIFGEALTVADIQGAARDGEDLAGAFSRLSSEFMATNAVAIALGKDAATAFGEIGLASTGAREDLIKLSGGIDALTSKSNFFYQNFLTDAEKLAFSQKLVDGAFQELGISGVKTVEQFKDLVNSIDLSTESGRKLYAALMNIAPAFLQVAQSAETLLTTFPRVVNGMRTTEPIPERSTTPWEQQGPAPTARGVLPGRNAPGPATRGFGSYFAEIAAQIEQAQKMIAELVANNPLTVALASNGTQWEKLTAAGNALETLTSYYDGTAEATTNLSQSTRDYYDSLVQMLAVIDQLRQSIGSMFADSIRYYKTSGMSPAEEYAFITQEVAGFREQLATATDPTQINYLAGQINTEQRRAFSLLTPDQQAQVRGQYIDAAGAANKLAQERLDEAEKKANERWDKLIKGVKDALSEAGSPFVTAGNTMNAAGAAMLLASRNSQTPTRTTPSAPSSPVITPRTPSDVNA